MWILQPFGTKTQALLRNKVLVLKEKFHRPKDFLRNFKFLLLLLLLFTKKKIDFFSCLFFDKFFCLAFEKNQ